MSKELTTPLDMDGWVEVTRRNHCGKPMAVRDDLELREPVFPGPSWDHWVPGKDVVPSDVLECAVCGSLFSRRRDK